MAFNMDFNSTYQQLPQLPAYTLRPQPSLIPGVPDLALQLGAPIIAYWVVSMTFYILDEYDLFPQYRLHTPAELLKRNHVTKYEVIRDVVVQQGLQTLTGIIFSYIDGPSMIGREQHDVATWALRLRLIETRLPQVLALLGVNSPQLASRISSSHPTLAAILAGGRYPTASFAPWELSTAKAIYWLVIPFLQFVVGIVFVDTWQYFLHRGMHMNKFLYTWLHARHHRLYVPYAFGALYNHPIEGFLLDILGTGLASIVTGMTMRQSTWFYTCSTIKTVDDHCGYAFPWDPLQHVTSNNAAYHDIHHQSWGIKTNFSQPFFTFWDRFLGTVWTGGDVSARYQRAKLAAQKQIDADKLSKNSSISSITNSPATDLIKAKKQADASRKQTAEAGLDNPAVIFREEAQEERDAQQSRRRSPRRRQSGKFDPKSLSGKVSGSLYGRGTPILHADGVH